MSLFNFGSKSKLGIDIGTAAIKIVEIENSGHFKLKNYGLFELKSEDGVVNLGPGSETHGQTQLSDQDIIWAIKESIKKAKISARDAVASIQSFSTFSTVVNMPYLSEADLAKAIPFEAKKYIPLPLSEVILDWSILGTSNSDNKPGQSPSSVEVFLVAVPRDEAARYQMIMKNAGLNLKALEVENAALIRSIVGNDLSPVAIINIGGRSSGIMIADRGVERLSHNYEVGGFEITKSIARSLGVGLSRAEDLKREMGLKQVDSNTVRSIMSSLVDLIVFETRKTIHQYEDNKRIKIARIFLVGGMANMPGFVEYFGEKLGQEVVVGSPTARLVIPKELEPLRSQLNTTFPVAIGLAMRNI